MQDHALEGQDKASLPFGAKNFPENQALPTQLVHCETQANVPTHTALGIQLSADYPDLSNCQRLFVWGIENSPHWVMDMVFRDDECRVRTDHAPANFTTIKHMAHNLLRRAPGKDSLRLRRKVAAWDDDFLASLIAA